MVCKLCDIEQVRDKFAHHLAGIVLTIVRKGQLLVMVKELLAHITFHVGTHHMALITYVVFAEALDDIHGQETDRDPGQCTEDRSAVLRKERVCHRTQDLRICEIYDTDKSRAD